MGLLSRRYEDRVPRRLRVLGESRGAPKPNRYLPSVEAGLRDIDVAFEDLADDLSDAPDADVLPDETRQMLETLRAGNGRAA